MWRFHRVSPKVASQQKRMPAQQTQTGPTPPTIDGPQPTTDSESLELPITIGISVGILVCLLGLATTYDGHAMLALAIVVMFIATGWVLALMARLLDG